MPQPKHINLLTLPAQTSAGNSSNIETIKSVFFFCLFLTISFCTTHTFAQFTYELDKTTRFERIGVDQGLSSRYITCIYQDNNGFIWIGTQNGLNLYDGYEFKIFSSDIENPNSLPDNYIYKIIEGKDSIMWICTEYGLSRYNRASEDFTNFYPDTIDYYNPINSIREINEFDENLMINAGGKLYKFNNKSHTFHDLGKTLFFPPRYSAIIYVTMFLDSSGMLWVFSNDNDNLILYK